MFRMYICGMKLNRTAILVFSVAFLLLLLLIRANWKSPHMLFDREGLASEKRGATNSSLSEAYSQFMKEAGIELKSLSMGKLNSIAACTDTALLNKTVKFLDSLGKYKELAALFDERARTTSQIGDMKQAAHYFLLSAGYSEQPVQELMFGTHARTWLEAIVRTDPDDLSSKVDLAICVDNINTISPPEDQTQLMIPAMSLLEVVRKDSNHYDANFYLGKLGVKSGQYENAVKRFKKTISLQPQKRESYIELMEVFRLMGDTANENSIARQLKNIK
jgi:tetratricopeptide (TPR) repeat protein